MKSTSLIYFFKTPATNRQRQYEALRSIVVDGQKAEKVAEKFGYQKSTLYSLLRDMKAGKLDFFPPIRKGPKQRTTSALTGKKIEELRMEGLSVVDIRQRLADFGTSVSESTIERILKDAGYGKLERRTLKEIGKSRKNTYLGEKSELLNFEEMKHFSVDCPSVGVFFFLPYILESGLVDVLSKMELPESEFIKGLQACLSMLLVKLIGVERLSRMQAFDHEPGLGIFAGLNVLPKARYYGSYSCRWSEEKTSELQSKIIEQFKRTYPDLYPGRYINLDFHSIPHHGDGEESVLENVWCGAKGKTMRGVNSILAQDADSKAVVYTRTDILRSEEKDEVKKFVDYWRKVSGKVDETLVFDCKFTTYLTLDELHEDNVKFITLRKRNQSLLKRTSLLPEEGWEKATLNIPKRKYQRVSIYEEEVQLSGCSNKFRQIIIKDHGRELPTYIVSNNQTLSMTEILEVYARRWRVENKLAEMVSFFNLNALSSPIMVRIHFDIVWMLVADTLYRVFARDLRRFENKLAPTLFRDFIDMPGQVIYDGKKFVIEIRKRAHTPVLQGVEKLRSPFNVPWLENKTVEIIWKA